MTGPLFTIPNAFELGWMTLKSRYAMLLIGVGISIGIALVQTMCIRIVQSLFGVFFSSAANLACVFFVSGPLAVGLYANSLAAVRGGADWRLPMSTGLRRYREAVLLMVFTALIGLAVMGPAVLIVVAGSLAGAAISRGAGTAMVILLMLVVLLPALLVVLWIKARLALSVMLVGDERTGAVGAADAIRLSWRLSQPVQWKLLGLEIVVGLMVFACAAFLFLPAIFLGMPLGLAVWAAAYQQVLAQSGMLREISRCPACNYDLSGQLGSVCPECGAQVGTAWASVPQPPAPTA